jgi:Coenzyme PQQ synthesis protein D (PqqD)
VTITDPPMVESVAAWCRAERVLWRRTLDGVVVLPVHRPAAARPVALTGSAAGIWDLLAEPMTAADLVAALAATYGVHEERVADEVGGALETLLELGALCRD